MDSQEYHIMAHVEQKHWWYRGLRDLVTFTLKSLVKHNPTILDAGCGTGENFIEIHSYLPGATVIGIDNSREAWIVVWVNNHIITIRL